MGIHPETETVENLLRRLGTLTKEEKEHLLDSIKNLPPGEAKHLLGVFEETCGGYQQNFYDAIRYSAVFSPVQQKRS